MKFRKKPAVIEAVQWIGTSENLNAIYEFMGNSPLLDYFPRVHPTYLIIHTLEGNHQADIGDWVIKGVAGEYYPCKPDIFEQTYEPVREGK